MLMLTLSNPSASLSKLPGHTHIDLFVILHPYFRHAYTIIMNQHQSLMGEKLDTATRFELRRIILLYPYATPNKG